MKRLIEGIELIGRSKEDGYKTPLYLIRTPNKHFIQLSQLLYFIVEALLYEKTEHNVAESVSSRYGKIVSVQAVRYLIETKLEPLGIISDSSVIFEKKKRSMPQAPSMLQLLRYRFTLLPEHAVRFIALFYLPLFDVRVIWTVLSGVLLLNIWLFGIHGLSASLKETLYEPSLFLLIFGLILLSSLFHEIGHAAGTIYGGGKPGRIGAGMYLIWPAFFTDVTDVYRLGRRARLRSDFGGVYFNFIFSLIIGIVYFLTQFEPLLLLVLFQNLAVMHQLIPFFRLDGYFIVSDLVGIPDLSVRIKPILRNVFLRKKSAATNNLKLWVKLVVSLWVSIMIPLLFIVIGVMLVNAPNIFSSAWSSALIQLSAIAESVKQEEYMTTMINTLQLVVFIFPALGTCTILYLLGKPVIQKINAKLDSYAKPQALRN